MVHKTLLKLAVTGVLLAAAPAVRAQIVVPANDLNPLLALTGVASPAPAPIQQNPEPALVAVPPADCGPGSHPLDALQGRVPASAIDSPQAKDGWTCNTHVIGHQGGPGGFRTWRYVDPHGHECAYYDTALLHPSNAVSVPGLPGTGVAVLDMADPAHPVQTDLLTSLPMQAPHESLNLNTKRGLLAAEMGNGATFPGLMSIYDASGDCRHPLLGATTLGARFGHESGFAADGKTFWIAGGEGLAAVDVTNPKVPITIWQGAEFTHGLTLSDDGNRLYMTDPIDGNLAILDVSEVQARKPAAEVREVSRLTWQTVSIPQNTAPMQIAGKPYLLEFDEFNFRFTAIPQTLNAVGAARIIDIADDAHPRVVSNLRLAINQPEAHQAALTDPGALSPAQGYAAHYCAIPREVDPGIVACSFINSGLRIFDIRDPLHPREAAYFIAPPAGGLSNGGQASDFAMSQPAFAPERREVWYTDAISGFWAVRLDKAAWPDPVTVPKACPSHRTIVIHLAGRPALRSFRVTVAGRRVSAVRAGRGGIRIRLSNRSSGRVTVRVRAVTRAGKHIRTTRHYRTCAAGR